MAEKDDKEFAYVAALQDFNKSIEYLIKAVQAQVENKQDFKSMVAATAEQFKEMATMAEELTVIVETTSSTKEDTKKILQVVEGLKKQKKTGIWEKLSPKDKTKGIGEGIKTITLMAGAILAIGTAFKVIGDVDFASVLALSIALPLIGETFNRMDKTLKPKDAAIMSLNMIIMSAGLAVSGAVLTMMPELGFKQMISVIGVAIGMSIAMIGMGMVSDNLNAKEIKNLFIIAATMPAVALGLLLSAEILTGLPQLPFMKTVETTAGVVVSVGIAALAITLLSKIGLTPVMAIEGSIAMIAVAGGLLATSLILAQGDYSTYPTLEWGLNAGAALLGGGLLALGMGSFLGQIIPGVIGMIAVAGGILASSLILAEGEYGKYPNLDWAEGVGLSMGAFGLGAVALGAIIMTGVGAIAIGLGIAGMMSLAAAIVEVSHILKGGDWGVYPSLDWAQGVGTSITLFTNAITQIAPGPLDMLFGDSMESRIASIVKIGEALKLVSFAVKGGDYTGGPKKEWSEGIGLALFHFTSALNQIEPSFLDKWVLGETTDSRIASMVGLAGSLHQIGVAVGSDNSVYQGGPDARWASGVGGSLLAFAQTIKSFDDAGIDLDEIPDAMNAIKLLAPLMPLIAVEVAKGDYSKFPDVKWSEGIGKFFTVFSDLDIVDDPVDAASGITLLAGAYLTLSKSLNVLSTSMKGLTKVPDLTGIYGGLVTLSVIDKDNLGDVLDKLNDKQSEFTKVFEMIRAQGSVKIDESTFAFNKDRKEVKSETASSFGGGSAKSAAASIPTIKKPEAAKPTGPTQSEMLMQKMVQLQGQMIALMQEVADNTTPKLATSGGNLIDN